MCGIVGYSGARNAVRVLLEGLSALEYRGYDSAGVSVFTENGLQTVKSAGRLAVVPIENARMTREISLVYHRDFGHPQVLEDLRRIYNSLV